MEDDHNTTDETPRDAAPSLNRLKNNVRNLTFKIGRLERPHPNARPLDPAAHAARLAHDQAALAAAKALLDAAKAAAREEAKVAKAREEARVPLGRNGPHPHPPWQQQIPVTTGLHWRRGERRRR
jgi:hypothetical protein